MTTSSGSTASRLAIVPSSCACRGAPPSSPISVLDNFLYVGFIKRLFPDAKIVHTTRDPLDTCLSIFFLHLEQRMSYALNIRDIGHFYREYRRLMAHWNREFGGDIFEFNYDALVKPIRRRSSKPCVSSWRLPGPERCQRSRRAAPPSKQPACGRCAEPLYQQLVGPLAPLLR